MREYGIWMKEKTKKEKQDFENKLRDKGFPEGYVKYLMILHDKYPKWEFEPVFTNVDYQEFLEYQMAKQNKCAETDAYCTDKRFSGEDDSKYYIATEEAVRYFSHPYSMLLTDLGAYENALQFLNAEQELPKEFSDTLVLSILRDSNSEIAELIKDADTCVNPVFLASIYGCEKGPVGELYNGKAVYNPFNIGATSGRTSSLEYAYKNGWFTAEKSLEESEEFLQQCIDRGQNTLYALDWDYQSFDNGNTVKQYATLVNDAENKAMRMSNIGGKTFNLDYELTFSIPVYDNIPTYNNEEFMAFPDPNKQAVKGESYY